MFGPVPGRVPFEAEAEGPHRVRTQARHDGNDEGRIDAAGEKRPDGYVRDETPFDGLRECVPDARFGFSLRQCTRTFSSRAYREVPVSPGSGIGAVQAEHLERRRRKLSDAAIERMRRRDVTVRQKLRN